MSDAVLAGRSLTTWGEPLEGEAGASRAARSNSLADTARSCHAAWSQGLGPIRYAVMKRSRGTRRIAMFLWRLAERFPKPRTENG
jgi:hypothetical protein